MSNKPCDNDKIATKKNNLFMLLNGFRTGTIKSGANYLQKWCRDELRDRIAPPVPPFYFYPLFVPYLFTLEKWSSP